MTKFLRENGVAGKIVGDDSERILLEIAFLVCLQPPIIGVKVCEGVKLLERAPSFVHEIEWRQKDRGE